MAVSTDKKLSMLLEIDTVMESLIKLRNNVRDATAAGIEDGIKNSNTKIGWQKEMLEWTNRFKGVTPGTTDPNTRAGLQLLGEGSKTSNKIADDIMKIMKSGIGIIEDIHARIKQASPFLEAVESMFNLAMQLFFMPLGNKLAEVMLPAILQLVDDVVAMWDKLEGLDLGQMLTAMIDYGTEIFGKYFQDLGERLSEQGGLLGSLGKILTGLGGFIEDHLSDLIEMGLNVLQFIMEHFGTLLNAFIEFKMLSISLQVAQIAATVAAGTKLGSLSAGVAILAGAATMAAGNAVYYGSGVKEMTDNMNMAASGAYVGATEGGRKVRVGEGGEGEFILPESRLKSMMDSVSDRMVDVASGSRTVSQEAPVSSTTINNHFYFTGYNTDEMISEIKTTVNEQIVEARIKGGY